MKSEPHPSAPRNLCRPGASFRPHAVHLLRQPNLLPLCFHTLTNPFFPNSLVFTSIQNPRGCHPPNISVQDFATSASLCLCGKPFSFKCLRALDLSLRSFSRPFPLFSIACGLFLQNTRGCGVPRAFRPASNLESPTSNLEPPFARFLLPAYTSNARRKRPAP